MTIEDFEELADSINPVSPKPIMLANTAILETDQIGDGTKIWHFTHICKGAVIGKNCTIGEGVYVGPGVIIGDNCKIQNHAQIFAGVTIGNECFIGPCVCFTNDKTPHNQSWWEEGWSFEPEKTIIGNRVSIGANSTILCGITLNDGCVVGAGSVVTKDVEPFKIVYGNPAK